MTSIPQSDTSQCFSCSLVLKRKKLNECNDCGQCFCKNHIKLDDQDCSTLCISCLKKRVHLEISMGMEQEILQHKSSLRQAKSHLKSSKSETQKLEEKQVLLENSLKNSQKKHENETKELNFQLKQVSESVDWAEHEELVSKELVKRRKELLVRQDSLKRNLKLIEEAEREERNLKGETQSSSVTIQTLSDKIKNYISYAVIRSACCENCKNLVKKNFQEEILNGYPGRNSVSASMAKGTERSVRYSIDKKKEQDSCNCLIV